MEHFITATKLIKTTKNYPKEGIDFADLSAVVNSAALRHLLPILCSNMGIDKDWVLVGIPSRGCHLALLTAVASGKDPLVIQLQKGGTSTLMPHSEELCSSGTVYSGDKRSTYFIDADNAAHLRSAHHIVLCDDVIESGETMRTIGTAIRKINPTARMTALCLLLLGRPEGLGMPIDAVMDKPKKEEWIRPHASLCARPHLLGTLRGSPHIPACLQGDRLHPMKEAVYGPPSMTQHLLCYVSNVTHAFLGDATWDYFAGGCPNFRIQEYADKYNIVFLYDASAAIEIQNYMVRELARTCRGSMRILIPYMPQATMERIDVPGTVATAKFFLDALCSGLPPVADGRIVVEVVDIHCTGEAFYVPSNVRFVPSTILRKMIRTDAKIVAFPDDGAFKRFGHEFRGFTQVICSKMRDGPLRKIDIKNVVGPLSINGNEVTLVDDLTRTGGTLMETAKELKKRGVSRIHVVFVHADLEDGRSHALVTCPDIDTITCTDSCLQKAYVLRQLDYDKVTLYSVFGFVESAVDECLGGTPLLAVASKDEAKNTAAFNVFQYSMKPSYLSKEWAPSQMRVPCANRIVGTLAFAVDSHVPEQPVGDDEGVKGVTHRLAGIVNHFVNSPSLPCVAFESFMRKQPDGSFVDTVCAAFVTSRHEMKGPAFAEGAIPPTDLATEAIGKNMVVGELLMQRYNLPDKASWIQCFSRDRTSRVEQLEHALRLCDVERFGMKVGGGR